MMPWLSPMPLDHLVEDAGARQVDEDGAEAHRQQQRRAHSPFDGEVDEREAHEVHHALLPRYGSKAVKQKAHKCNTLLYHRIGFGEKKKTRTALEIGCKDVFGKKSLPFPEADRGRSPVMTTRPTPQRRWLPFIPFGIIAYEAPCVKPIIAVS